MNRDHLAELRWIYETLQNKQGTYLLAAILEHKEYSSDDVHTWVMQDNSLAGIYGKIRDILQVRILAAIQEGMLDKTTGEGMLKTFYYKPYESTMEKNSAKVYTRMDAITYSGKDLAFIVGNNNGESE